MPQMIQHGKGLIRINPTKKSEIEHSENGSYWIRKFSGDPNIGEFLDLLSLGDEILALLKNGKEIYYSKTNGANWIRKFSGDPNIGNFHSLSSNGSELLANTDKGLYYSNNSGSIWYRK